MSSAIQSPPFPPLTLATWNDRGGRLNGDGLFPAWASLQSAAPPNHDGDTGDGSFHLTINTPAGAHDRPASEQVAAYAHLLQNAERIFDAILQSIFDEYGWMREDFVECLSTEQASRLVPELNTPIELLPLLSFGTMTIHRVFNDGLAYIGLSFGCTWDDEHGLGVLIHGSRIVSVGGCDTSFMEWIPESDVRGDA